MDCIEETGCYTVVDIILAQLGGMLLQLDNKTNYLDVICPQIKYLTCFLSSKAVVINQGSAEVLQGVIQIKKK